jgi:hypothetical protein
MRSIWERVSQNAITQKETKINSERGFNNPTLALENLNKWRFLDVAIRFHLLETGIGLDYLLNSWGYLWLYDEINLSTYPIVIQTI